MTWRLMASASPHRRKHPYPQWEFGSDKCWCETKSVLCLCLNTLCKSCLAEVRALESSGGAVRVLPHPAVPQLQPIPQFPHSPITRLGLAAPVGAEGLKGRGCAEQAVLGGVLEKLWVILELFFDVCWSRAPFWDEWCVWGGAVPLWAPSGVTSWHRPLQPPQVECEPSERSGAFTVGLVLGTHMRK